MDGMPEIAATVRNAEAGLLDTEVQLTYEFNGKPVPVSIALETSDKSTVVISGLRTKEPKTELIVLIELSEAEDS